MGPKMMRVSIQSLEAQGGRDSMRLAAEMRRELAAWYQRGGYETYPNDPNTHSREVSPCV